MAFSDEDIIRRKLLIEGDGGNDDRRLTTLLKTFTKWSQTTQTEEESNATLQKMLSQLVQCELSVAKAAWVYQTNLQERDHYQQLNLDIETKMMAAVEDIKRCKNELVQAKCSRKNRQEYDALARVIQQHPDRQTTTEQLSRLNDQLQQLNERKEALDNKLELRRKEFNLLIVAIHEMQKILENND